MSVARVLADAGLGVVSCSGSAVLLTICKLRPRWKGLSCGSQQAMHGMGYVKSNIKV